MLENPQFSGIMDTNIGKTYTSLHAGADGGAGSVTREFDRKMERERIRAYEAGKVKIERMATETGGELPSGVPRRTILMRSMP
jgi:hypothetical protein